MRSRIVSVKRPNAGWRSISIDMRLAASPTLATISMTMSHSAALIAEEYQQFFLFVCKPDSHVALYRELELLDQGRRRDDGD